ncbi:MAG: hypothetical protein WCO84_03350 [bacterium]
MKIKRVYFGVDFFSSGGYGIWKVLIREAWLKKLSIHQKKIIGKAR